MDKQNKKVYLDEIERRMEKEAKKREAKRRKKMKVDSSSVKQLEKLKAKINNF